MAGKFRRLFGIVENDSQCVALARMNGTDAMPKGGAIVATYPADETMVDGKDDRIAAVGIERFGARLLPRALLAKDKLAAVKILAALTEKNSKIGRAHV